MAGQVNLLEEIRQQSQAARQSSAATAMATQQSSAEAERIVSTMVADSEALGKARAVQVTAVQTAQMQAQKQMQGAVDAAGGFDTLYALIGQSAKTAQAVATGVQTVRQQEETRLIDDPVTWIKAAVDWNNDRKKLAGGVQELQVLQGAASQITGQLSQVGALSKAAAKTVTEASISASASEVELTAALQANELRLKGLQYNIIGVEAAAKADDRILAVTTAEANFGRQEAQFQLALEHEGRQREQFNWQKEKEKAIRDERMDERSFEERSVHFINLGEAARGITPSTSHEIKDHIKLNKGLGPEYAELYENGRTAAKGGPLVISTSPAKVAGILARDPSILAGMEAPQKKLAELVLEARAVLGTPENKLALADDKTGAKASQLVTQQVQRRIAQQISYVGNNPDNVFYIGEPSSYIGTATSPGISSFQNYPLIEKVFNPAIASGTFLSDPSVPFGLTLSAIKAGQISSSQAAADFSQIYKRMSSVHRAAVDFRKFAIALPPDGATYRVKIEGEIIDVTDFNAVARAMNRSLSRSALPDYRKGLRVNPGLEREMNKRTQGFPNE